MKDIKAWKITEQKTLVDSIWLRLDQETARTESGALISPFFTEYRPDFSLVAALDAEKNLLTVRQYRRGIEAVLTELPAGMIDPGEDPLTAAERELLEETGYVADEWIHLFDLTINAAYSSTKAHCYLATGLRKTSEQKLEDTENLEYEWISYEQVLEMLHSGAFANGFNVAAVYRALEVIDENDEQR